MRSSLLSLPMLLILGCTTSHDLRLDDSLTSADRALALRMSELTQDRCVRQQFDPTVMMSPGTQAKFSSLPVVKRLYRSDSGWVKAEIAGGGSWDNIYFFEPKNVVICGEQNWQKLAETSTVRFNDVQSKSYQATVPPAAPSNPPAAERRAVAFRWASDSRLMAGIVTLQQRGRAGTIAAKLPTGDGECTGVFEAIADGSGQWALSCTNGLTAVGTFKALGQGKGSVGTGTDSKGQRVEFTLSGAP